MRRERISPSRWPGGDNDKTEADSIQQWKATLMLVEIVYDTMASKLMDPLKVEKRQLREVSWANKHTTHELVNGANKQRQQGQKRKSQFAVSVEPSAVQSVPLRDSLNTADGGCFAVH